MPTTKRAHTHMSASACFHNPAFEHIFIHVSCNPKMIRFSARTHSQCVCIAITLDNSINSILKSLWHASRIPTTDRMISAQSSKNAFLLRVQVLTAQEMNQRRWRRRRRPRREERITCISLKRDGSGVCVRAQRRANKVQKREEKWNNSMHVGFNIFHTSTWTELQTKLACTFAAAHADARIISNGFTLQFDLRA